MFGWVYPGLLGVVSKKAASSLRMGLNVGILVHFVEDLFGGGSGWVRGTFTEGTSIPQQQAVRDTHQIARLLQSRTLSERKVPTPRS